MNGQHGHGAEPRDQEEQARRPGWVLGPFLGLVVVLLIVASGVAGRRALATPGDESAEAGFARDMSTHDAQGVEMALLIRDRTEDPLVAGLALDIVLTQQAQIGRMSGWLDVWGLPATGDDPPMAWMGHAVEGRMPGMASPEEIAHLKELSGVEADREFLRLMIRHHEGGAPMAQALLERSDDEAVRRLARSIVQSQQAEVEVMRRMLTSKETTPPAVSPQVATPSP